MNLETPTKIRETLYHTLGNIGKFEKCVLLDYPDYLNIGDHLIWLGTLFYLTQILNTKIEYAASIDLIEHSGKPQPEFLDEKLAQYPIILQGGGNFGDTWPRHQDFREKIIERYRDRPIIIMPQSIYYRNPESLKKTVYIFNNHPNLTIFVRDHSSYEIACKNFYNCRVLKAPDMIFALSDLLIPSYKYNPNFPILYHCRNDSEFNAAFAPDNLGIPNLAIQDWACDHWVYKGKEKIKDYWQWPALATIVRELWQRRLSVPQEWKSRREWQQHPRAPLFNAFNDASIHHFSSWGLMHCGLYQLMQSRVVITNRLHGHLLCVLLGIPHVFLPNSYHKNEFFYQEWTYQIPYAKFMKEPRLVKGAVEELMAAVSQGGKSAAN